MKPTIDRSTLSKEELRMLRSQERVERRERTKMAIMRDKLELEKLRKLHATSELSALAKAAAQDK